MSCCSHFVDSIPEAMFCFFSYCKISEKIQLVFTITNTNFPKPAVQKAANSPVLGLCSTLGVLLEGCECSLLQCSRKWPLSQKHFEEWEGT